MDESCRSAAAAEHRQEIGDHSGRALFGAETLAPASGTQRAIEQLSSTNNLKSKGPELSA